MYSGFHSVYSETFTVEFLYSFRITLSTQSSTLSTQSSTLSTQSSTLCTQSLTLSPHIIYNSHKIYSVYSGLKTKYLLTGSTACCRRDFCVWLCVWIIACSPLRSVTRKKTSRRCSGPVLVLVITSTSSLLWCKKAQDSFLLFVLFWCFDRHSTQIGSQSKSTVATLLY